MEDKYKITDCEGNIIFKARTKAYIKNKLNKIRKDYYKYTNKKPEIKIERI